ncbi:MAG TPA: dihydroorotase [Acidobacteria bacterium]|nr:dihydroorotase [Acidobacteriota bacterium]
MSRLLLRNGRVVDPSQSLDQGLDLLLEDGRVAALGERLDVPGDTPALDASGLVAVPGLIDLHVHLREPGFEYKETIETGCRAAVAGGFTAVCAMPNTNPVNDDPSVTRFIRERAAAVGLCHVYPIGALSKGERGEELAEIGEMVREGAVAISDDGRPVMNARLMRRALEYARSFGVRIAAHEEDTDLADGGSMHEGPVSTRIGLKGIPAAAEEVMVARDVLLTELTGGSLHLCHLSTRGSLDLVRMARRRGIDVTCEVTPHHFMLSDEDLAASNYDTNWKMNPPLRSRDDVEAVLQGIYDGTVDAIVTDHAPHHADEKELDFADAPFGIVGLETAVSLALDRLVHGRVIGLLQLVRLMSTRPAELFGLPGGTLKEGAPADVTLLDLRKRVTVDPDRFRSKSRNTPFAGLQLRGAPVATIVGGRIVWQAGQEG